MRRRVSIGLYLGICMIAVVPVAAQTGPDCIKKNKEERWASRAEFDHANAACRTDQCFKDALAKYRPQGEKVRADQAACDAYLRSQQAAPQSPANWKPGDPSPVAPNGQRYIMSCSGKAVGVYKPGGAMEVELQSRPGNCIPSDNPWPGPGVGGTAATGHCYEQRTGSYKEYSGGRPNWCDPSR